MIKHQTTLPSSLFAWSVLPLALLLAPCMKADTITWTAGSGVNFNWSNSLNWSSTEPGLLDDVIFPSAIPNPGTLPTPGTLVLSTGEQAQSLTFDANGYTLSGGELALGGTGQITISNAAHTATISSVLNGSNGLSRLGAGNLILSGSSANTYTGTTSINAGLITLSKTAGVNAITGDIVISNGGRLAMTTAEQIANTATVTMSGSGSVFNGTGNNGGQSNVAETIGNLFVTGGTVNAGSGAQGLTITGATSFTGGAGNSIFVGNSGTTYTTGSLSLTGMTGTAGGATTVANSFTIFGNSLDRVSTLAVGSGGITLDNSRIGMRKGNASTFGSRIVLDGNITTAGTAGSFIVQDTINGTVGQTSIALSSTAGNVTRTINTAGTASLTIGVAVTNGQATNGSILKTGMSSLTINGGEISTYTGTTTVEGGSMILAGVGTRLANTTGITVTGGTFQDGDSTAVNNSGISNRINAAANLTLGGVNGGGTFTLAAAANTFSHSQTLGNLIIASPLNTISTNAATGTNTLTFTGTYTRQAGSWVNFALQTGFNVNFAVNPTTNGSSVFGTGGNAILAGAFLNGTDFVAAQAGNVTAATYTDTGTTSWINGANMNVTGTNPVAYTSETINSLRYGTLAANTVTLDGTHTITSGTILVTPTVGANASTLAGGQIQAGGSEPLSVIQNNTAGELHISSQILGSNGLFKSGAGLLRLTGSNSYSGTTRVVGGTLQAENNVGLSANSNVVIDNAMFAPIEATFTRALGTAAGEMQFTGAAAGFTAIGGNKVVNMGGSGVQVQWGNVTFNPATFVLNDAAATGTLDFQNAIDLNGAARTVSTVANTTATTSTISGVISNSTGTSDLIKRGAGTLVLSGNNTYGGTTTVTEGTLGIGHNNALGSSTVRLNGGTIRAFGGARTVTNNFLQTAATAISGTDSLNISGSFTAVATADISNNMTAGATFQLSGPVYLSASNSSSNIVRFVGGGTTLISGVVANNAGANTLASHLFYNGGGILTLTADNTFTGSTLVATGIIAISKDSNLGIAPSSAYEDSIILANLGKLRATSTFELNQNRHIGIGNSSGGTATGTLDVSAGQTFTVAGIIDDRDRNQDNTVTPANVGSLVKAGTGTLILKADNDYSGTTTVSDGLLRIDHGGALGNSTGGTTVAADKVLQLGDGVVVTDEIVTITGTGQAFGETLALGALQAGVSATASWNSGVVLSGTAARIGAQTNGRLIVNGVISGTTPRLDISASVTNGVVVLGAQNTYGDGTAATVTNLVRGLTVLGIDNALPTTGTLDVHFASSNNAEYAGLDMNGFDQTVAVLRNTGVTGTNAEITNRSHELSTLTINQNIDTTYAGIITGNTSVVKNGTGVVTLGTGNTYTGDTIINSGTVRASGDAIPDGVSRGDVVLNGGAIAAGTLDLNSGSQVINALNGNSGAVVGRVVNDNTTGNSSTLRIGASGASGSFAGQILNNSGGAFTGIVTVTKVGQGTQVLSGANTFTGAVSAFSGTLQFDYANNDPLSGNAVRLVGGNVHLKGSAAGTTDSVGAITLTTSTLGRITVDQSAGGASTWTAPSMASVAGVAGSQGVLLLDRSLGGNLVLSSPISGSVFMTSNRAIAFVKDSSGTGFMAQNGSNELVRYTSYNAGTTLDATLSNGASHLLMNSNVNRSAALNFSTLLVDTTSSNLTLNMGANGMLTADTSGRSILVNGNNNFTLTGSGTIGFSIYISSFGEGKTTIDMGMAAGQALVTNGTGFMEFTKTVTADVFAIGNLLRLSAEQNYNISNVLTISSGGVIEIGADLATSSAADFTRIVNAGSPNTRLLGDSGFSAYTAAPGGVRVVRLGTVTAGDGNALTWGANNFLVSPDVSPSDIDSVFKLSSAQSNATLEFQNPINFNNRVRTVEVANGLADIDARLTGILSSTTGGLNKTGLGTLEITAQNTYGGGTYVRQGILLANSSTGSSTGTGQVRVYSGATLGGTGNVGSATTAAHVVVESGGILMVGNTHDVNTGTASKLTLQSTGAGVLSLNGIIEFDIFDNSNNGGINPTSNNDVLALQSSQTVQLSGSLLVDDASLAGTSGWLANSSWQLFDWTQVTAPQRTSGTFSQIILPDLDSEITGLYWDASNIYTTGYISIVPEPGRAMLLMLGMAGLLFRRRR